MTVIRNFAERTVRGLAELGMTLADETQIIAGRDLAARTVGPHIASVETLCLVQAWTGCSSFALTSADGELAGVIAVFPLKPAARATLAAGVLNGIQPDLELVARPGEPVEAWYGWGMAGATWRGRAAVMAGAIRLHREIHPDLPLYGRAATPGGERTLLKRIGAHPVPGPGGLVMAPAWRRQRKAA